MKKTQEPKYKQVMWVRSDLLGSALHAKNHRMVTSFRDMQTGKLEWLFADTQRLRSDIKKFENRKLLVNARMYAIYLTGRFYEDEDNA